jgi:hypothetical protein
MGRIAPQILQQRPFRKTTLRTGGQMANQIAKRT